MPTDAKVEHLKLIQTVVGRMASNSFLLRGWTATLVAALFAFGAKDADKVFVLIAWVPLLVFAGLDAYYLMMEQRFRDLYNSVAAAPDDTPTNFSMDVTAYQQNRTWAKAVQSKTIKWYYLPLAGLLILLSVGVLAGLFQHVGEKPGQPCIPCCKD